VREETEHAARVLSVLEERGLALLPDRPSPYVDGLLALAGRPRRRSDGFLDSALAAAVIERRSHERFACLRACPGLADLHGLYGPLAEAEQRHGELFLELAVEAAGRQAAEDRLAALLEAEGELIASLPFTHRVHGGPP
jgi:tRNA-(ms[2]io[6]A)-hydroxylase